MMVEVLLFASLRDELGGSITLEVAEDGTGGTTVGALRAALARVSPPAGRLGGRLLAAVNERHAADSESVREGDVVAFLPPLAGG